MDERDMTLVMTTLFDIRWRVVQIHEALFELEDEDGEEPEAEDDT